MKEAILKACATLGIQTETLSDGYILRLTKGSTVQHIYGSHIDANPAAADRIACDKAACYAVLNHSGIPAIPHHLLQHPTHRREYLGENSTWLRALTFLSQYKQVVIKPNHGTNGKGIYLCKTIGTLETAIDDAFQTSPTVALSPFYELTTEYRIFYVFGKTPLVYAKTPAENSWKHNLNQGATAVEVTDKKKLAILTKMASNAAKAININFATVDIAQTKTGELLVMEINAGVQTKKLLEQIPHLQPQVLEIYTYAIQNLFT